MVHSESGCIVDEKSLSYILLTCVISRYDCCYTTAAGEFIGLFNKKIAQYGRYTIDMNMARVLPKVPIVMTVLVLTAVSPCFSKTSITIWTCFGFQPHKKTLDSIFSDFEKLNPDIDVKHIVPTSDSNILPEKLLTVMAGGSGPNISWVNPERVSWLYDSGAVIPLSSLEKVGGKMQNADFYKSMWQANYRKSQKWGVPFENSTLAMYYNKTLFTNAGIGRYPKTWSELSEVAQKLTSREKKTFGLATSYADWYFPMWLAQKGVGFTNNEGTKVTWDSPAAVEAVQWYTDLSTKYKVVGGAFTDGKTAMGIEGNWVYPAFAKSKLTFGVAPIPTADGGTPATFAAYKELLVFKAPNKEIVASWKLLQYIMEPAVFAKWCIATAYLPVTKSQSRYGDMAAYLEKNVELVNGHLNQTDDAYYPPILRNTKVIWETFQTGINQILAGKKSVQQALDESAKKAQVLLRVK